MHKEEMDISNGILLQYVDFAILKFEHKKNVDTSSRFLGTIANY